MGTVHDIKGRMDTLATRKEIADLVSRAEHSAAVVALENRLTNVETKVNANTPSALIDTLTKICLSISAVGGAGALIYHTVRAMP